MKTIELNKPMIFNYHFDFKTYFKDLNDFYIKTRPKRFWIKEHKNVIFRSLFGKFKIPITRYFIQSKNAKIKTFYLEDQIKEIRNQFELINFILQQCSSSSMSLSELASSIKNAYSKSWIYYKLNEIRKEKELKNNSFINNKRQNYLPYSNKIIYVEIDDCFQKLRDENNKYCQYKTRMIVIHNGVKDKKSKDKIVLLETNKTNQKGRNLNDLASLIKSKIKENFNIFNPKIILISDGARWMKKLAKFLNAIHYLDFFHVANKLRKTIGYGKYKSQNKMIFAKLDKNKKETFYQNIKRMLIENNVENVIEKLIFLIQNKYVTNLNITKINEVKSLINYLKNNKNLLNHFDKDYYIGSRTESFISHFIKKKTTKKFSIFSLKTFKFLIKSQEKSGLLFEFI